MNTVTEQLSGHEAVARTARTAFAAAETAGDTSTADLLTQRLHSREICVDAAIHARLNSPVRVSI